MPLPNSIDAPYNFVPLSDWVHTPDWGRQVSHDLPFRDGLCGHLDLTITAHSPILVGRERRPGEEPTDHRPGQAHPFQLPDGWYAIPGTALKGMIRNVVEIASFSRMAMVDDRHLGIRDLTPGANPIYRDSMTDRLPPNTFQPKSKAGWLRFDPTQNSWLVDPCDFARVEHTDLLAYHVAPWVNIYQRPSAEQKYASWVRPLDLSFTPGPLMSQPHSNGKFLVYRKASNLGTGAIPGVLVFTGQPSPNKHLEFIFYGSTGPSIRVQEAVFSGFLDIHDQRTEKNPRTHWDYWKGMARVPVFYLEQPGSPGTIASFGLALMYKLPYSHSIHDAIRNSSPHHLDQSIGDLASLIFGRVGDSPAACLKGRVAFQHAIASSVLKPVPQAPTILNGPKPTYYPNYIRQPRAHANRIPEGQGYSTLMENGCKVRGWKRYPARPTDQAQPQPLTQQQATTEVQTVLHTLPADARFVSRLTFHNLRPVELGALCWALTWGGSIGLRHGIGMGKPFGFGQVSISIDRSELRPNDRDADAPRWEECMDAFVHYMDQAHKTQRRGASDWRRCDEIRTLLAMANPDINPASGGRLKHMSLTTNNLNEFKDAKKARLVLADYPRIDHPPLWSEHEAKRLAKVEQDLHDIKIQQEQAEFDAKPEEERHLITSKRKIEAHLARNDKECSSKPRREEDLNNCLNNLYGMAKDWSEPQWREAAARLLEETYGDPRVGWGTGDKKQKQKQESKRKERIAELRAPVA